MKRTQNKFALLCLSVGAALASPAAMAEMTANADVTSNYVFRGQTLSADHAAVQGGLDYAHESGFYAGAWLSNVDADKSNSVTGTEYDLYAGVSNDFGEGPFGYDIGYLRYNFTDHVFPTSSDIKLGLKYGPASFNYYIGDTGAQENNTYGYYELGAKLALGEELELQLHYGVWTGDAAREFGQEFGGDSNVTDYSVGVSKEVAGFKVTLSYAEQEHDDPKPFVMVYKDFAL